MQPTQFNYPEFVPDQVLTSSNLNDLFNYLDEQERLTRANLVGIGIVCGLEITVSADGSQLTISQGCGITSGGYLVTYPGATLTQYKAYNAVKPLYYEKFVDTVNKTQLYNLDELFETAVTDGTTPLTSAYLSDKVVMLYVELLEDHDKNCDPASCDDKGKNIDITFKPLLISKSDAAKLKTVSTGYDNTAFQTLPVLKMPRYNVPASMLQSTVQILQEYTKILDAAFISNVQTVLSQSYNILLPLIKDIYPSNPFSTISQDFSFLNDNTITASEAINLQYYYDLFSDIELAYDELREAGIEALSLCCPDVNLFRLHLLLGDANIGTNVIKSENRQYFIPSPVMECECKQTQRLRWLFKRIQLLLQNFYVTFSAKGNFGMLYEFERLFKRTLNTTVRITPSSLGKYPLAKKAIPFYYLPVDGNDKLVDNWDIEKTAKGEADQNLSYNANLYSTEDFVVNPLNYDLEPYNFLRIEGHIGKQNTEALKSIINLRDTYRLPFEVVMLGSDLQSLKIALSSLGKTNTLADLIANYASQIKSPCQFQDLDAQYDTLIAEVTCQLCKVMLYFYNLDEGAVTGGQVAVVSQVPLVLKCSPGFMVQPGTFGYLFEQFYADNQGTNGFEFVRVFEKVFVGRAGSNLYYLLLLYIEYVYDTFADTLADLDINAFELAYKRLIALAQNLDDGLEAQQEIDKPTAGIIDQLRRLLGICIQRPLEALYKDYLLRWIQVMMLQKFGYYARKNPGVQHKAGVPMGGTFVMVYHEPPPIIVTTPTNNNFNVRGAVFENATNVKKAASKRTGKVQKEFVREAPSAGVGAISDINDFKLFASGNQVPIEGLDVLLQGLDVTESTLADVIPDIANGTVIADFYLPYLCCSDCPPIISTVTQVAQDLTISITPAAFRSDDTATYDITVTPDGGQVTGEGTSTDAAGKFIFSPTAVAFNTDDKQKDIDLVYNAFGQSVSTKVTVYHKPVAAFDATTTEESNIVTIKNNSSVFADKYSWDFGDTQTSTDKDPASHAYAVDGDYVIALTVANNIAVSDPVTQTVNIKTADVTINVDKNEFCSDDKGTVPINHTPDGSIVTGEGVTSAASGFVFTPNIVNLAGSANKVVTLTNKSGSKSASFNVTVFQKPVASFVPVLQTPLPGQVGFTNNSSAFATAYAWDFGDGSTSTDRDPGLHTYVNEGTFNVSLTVFNSTNCSANIIVPVTIQLPQANIDINPKIFCGSDDKSYPIDSGPSGSQVTGAGTSLSPDGSGKFVFTPIQVPSDGNPSQKVTLTNTLSGTAKTVDVTVFSKPDVKFTSQPATAPRTVLFNNQTVNADSYLWTFDTQGSSKEVNPSFTFSLAGTINVTLKATNGGVCTASITQPVVIQSELKPKVCVPVSNIVKLFSDLKSIDPDNFVKFAEAFKDSFTQMQSFFKSISSADSLDVPAQIDLFTKVNAVVLINKWIRELTSLFNQSTGFTGSATALIDILTLLIEHIECIQPEDLSDAKINLQEPLVALGIFCAQFSKMLSGANPDQLKLLAVAIAQFKQLKADLETEVAQMQATGGAAKQQYIKLFEEIINAIKIP